MGTFSIAMEPVVVIGVMIIVFFLGAMWTSILRFKLKIEHELDLMDKRVIAMLAELVVTEKDKLSSPVLAGVVNTVMRNTKAYNDSEMRKESAERKRKVDLAEIEADTKFSGAHAGIKAGIPFIDLQAGKAMKRKPVIIRRKRLDRK